MEHLVVDNRAAAIVARGSVISPSCGLLFPGALFACSYTVRCDAQWRVREVDVQVVGGARLQLQADGEGHWKNEDGKPLPQLDGCIDIDLSCSPFTNTLPIRRLGAALHRRHEIDVAYITVPDMTVAPSRQVYTALGTNHYRFESPRDAFQADIETDADGLVVHYPGLFRRLVP